MSLARLRRSARLVSVLLLVVSAFGLPHRSQADDACAALMAEQHDESKHVLTSESTAAHQDHCAVCHWLRWVKPVFSESPRFSGGRDRGTVLVFLDAQSLRNPASDQLPARAPPTL